MDDFFAKTVEKQEKTAIFETKIVHNRKKVA